MHIIPQNEEKIKFERKLLFKGAEINDKTIFGKIKEQVNYDYSTLKSALCPKCGKVELYIDINEKEITTLK